MGKHSKHNHRVEPAASKPEDPPAVPAKQAASPPAEQVDIRALPASDMRKPCPHGMTRVRAVKMLLNGGMSYEPGRVLFVPSEQVPRRQRLGQIEILEEV